MSTHPPMSEETTLPIQLATAESFHGPVQDGTTAPGSPLGDLLALPPETLAVRGLVHTLPEIVQQPATWRATAALVGEQRAALTDFLREVGVLHRPDASVLLVGAGTSDYIGHALTRRLARAWECQVVAVPSTTLLTELDEYVSPRRVTLLISFSRSGDSPEGVAVIGVARQRYPHVRHLVVTCNAAGAMARTVSADPAGHVLVLDDRVNDRGLAMTSSFTNMVVAGQCLGALATIAQQQHTVGVLADAGERLLAPAATLAQRLAAGRYTRVCMLGTGPLHAVARETALKVLELTAGRVMTMTETFLGARHGPLSAIDPSTLVIAFVSADGRRRWYEYDLLTEIRAKRLAGRTVAVIAGTETSEVPADDVFALGLPPSVSDDDRPPLDVILGQMLGLFSSIEHGLTPDAPSPTGAIARVVSGVRVHEQDATCTPGNTPAL